MKKILALLLSATVMGAFTTALAQEDGALNKSEGMRERIEESISRRESRDEVSETAQLSASEITLNGTVSFPGGGKAVVDTAVAVTAIKAGDVIMDTSNLDGYTVWVDIPKGQSSGAYSIEMPEGDYVIETYSYGCAENSVLGTWYYRDTTPTTQLSLAQKLSITKDTKLDLALAEAANSISGTITLTKPVEEDGYVYLYPTTYTFNNNWDYVVFGEVELPVAKGQKEIDYIIPAPAGITEVTTYMNGTEGLFSINGSMELDWDMVRYFDTGKCSYDDVDYVWNNGKAVQEEDSLELTIKLPEPAKQYISAYLDMMSEDGVYINTKNFAIARGEDTVTVTLSEVSMDCTLYLYLDGAAYYYGEGGVATIDNNKAATISAGTKELTMTIPKTAELTGVWNRNGVLEGWGLQCDIYLSTENSYYNSTIWLGSAEESAEYSIDIPGELIGQSADFDVYFGGQVIVSQTLTIEEDIKVDIEMDADMIVSVSGKLTITEPAPSGGVGVIICSSDVLGNVYQIPEGETELNYTAYLTRGEMYDETGAYGVSVELISEDPDFTGYIYTDLSTTDSAANADELEIYDCNYTTLSGTVSVPDGVVVKSGISVYIEAIAEDGAGTVMYCGTWGTINAGETSCGYEIIVPDDLKLTGLSCSVQGVAGAPVKTNFISHPEPDSDGISLSDGLTGMDFELEKGNAVIEVTSFGFADGKLTADVAITCDEDYIIYPAFVVAEYDEDGRLVDVIDAEVPSIFYRTGGASDVRKIYNNPVQNGNTYKLTVWDSISGMEPMMDVVETK